MCSLAPLSGSCDTRACCTHQGRSWEDTLQRAGWAEVGYEGRAVSAAGHATGRAASPHPFAGGPLETEAEALNQGVSTQLGCSHCGLSVVHLSGFFVVHPQLWPSGLKLASSHLCQHKTQHCSAPEPGRHPSFWSLQFMSSS